MTDIDPLDAKGRSAAARLLADVPASPPPLVEAQRRSRRRAARRTTVSTGLLVLIGVGVAIPFYVDRPARSDLQGPRAAEALDGPWRLPAPSEAVEVEVLVSPSATARPIPRPSVQARTAQGPWRARISGRTLVLRNPATNATVVQRIDFFAPGQFSVQELQSETSASGFGCTSDGQYSWALEEGTLAVDAVDDPCEARAAVLEAGTWTNLPFVDNDPTSTPPATEAPVSPEPDVTPTEPTTPDPPSEEPSSPSPAP